MSNWFENDSFWEHFAPIMFDEKRWAGTKWEVDNVVQLSGITPKSSVLDSCCGVGRHSLEFAKQGYRVTGIDRTKSYIDAAIELAEAEELSIEFILGDVRSFKRQNKYDLATNMFTSFGFFADERDEIQYVKNIYDSLVPGGTFVIDVNGKELLARDFVDTEAWEKDGNLLYTEYAIENSWNTLKNRWMIIDSQGERFEYVFSHRLYSAAELTALLQDCGFSSTDVYGSFDGRPYDNYADRLIVCARKS